MKSSIIKTERQEEELLSLRAYLNKRTLTKAEVLLVLNSYINYINTDMTLEFIEREMIIKEMKK